MILSSILERMHLPALKSQNGYFSILELDSAPQLAGKLGLDFNLQGGLEQFQYIVGHLIESLASYPSAVVADPEYTYPLLMDDVEQGLILRLDEIKLQQAADQANPQQTPPSPVSLPSLSSTWGVDEIANNYAVAKLNLSYHPVSQTALQKKKLVAELYEYAHHVGIDLIVKLDLYQQPDESSDPAVLQENQFQTIQELRDSCDLLAVSYPHNALAAASITAELDHPWVVVLDEGDYEKSKIYLRSALENGAAGFMIGESLWAEIEGLRKDDQSPDLEAIEHFIKTTARDRIIELVRITEEFSLPE